MAVEAKVCSDGLVRYSGLCIKTTKAKDMLELCREACERELLRLQIEYIYLEDYYMPLTEKLYKEGLQ